MKKIALLLFVFALFTLFSCDKLPENDRILNDALVDLQQSDNYQIYIEVTSGEQRHEIYIKYDGNKSSITVNSIEEFYQKRKDGLIYTYALSDDGYKVDGGSEHKYQDSFVNKFSYNMFAQSDDKYQLKGEYSNIVTDSFSDYLEGSECNNVFLVIHEGHVETISFDISTSDSLYNIRMLFYKFDKVEITLPVTN